VLNTPGGSGSDGERPQKAKVKQEPPLLPK